MKNKFEKLLKSFFVIAFSFILVAGTVSAVTRIMVPQGGTGQGSFEAGAFLIGNGTGAIATTTDVSSSLSLSEGYFYVGNGSNIAQATSTIYLKNDGDVQLAIGDNSGMRNMLQVVRDGGTTNAENVKALITSRNKNTTNNNWTGFSFQTEDLAGDIFSGARIMTQLTSHATSSVSGDLVFDTRNAGTRGEKMRILANGNIGIGTTSPAYKLDVYGNVRVDGTLTVSGNIAGGNLSGTNTGDQNISGYMQDIDIDTFAELQSWAVGYTDNDTTANESITLSGEIAGSGTTAITTTVADNIIDEANLKINAPTNDYVLTASSTASGGLTWAEAGGGGDVGGLYGINVETLSADKTLTVDSNKIYQYLDEGGANRIITLATAGASAGDRFVIKHNGYYSDTHKLTIKQGGNTLDEFYVAKIGTFIFNGTGWASAGIGVGDTNSRNYNIAIGYESEVYGRGVAVGYRALGWDYGVGVGNIAMGYEEGVAIGNQAYGYVMGVGVGYLSNGDNKGVSLGYRTDTNQKHYSVALGYYSETERYSEIAHCIDGSSTQDYNFSIAGWAKQTANATPVEMFLGEVNNQRFTINAESAVNFVIRITARDNVANEVASYKVEGLIKRDGSNNTTLVWSNKTVQYEDDVSWDVAVTADDTNEALKITVTSDGTNPVRWAGRIDEVETQF